MLYLVTYDLANDDRLEDLHKRINKLGDVCHAQKTVWYVQTNLTGVGIYERLKPSLTPKDAITIVETHGVVVGSFTDEARAWMRRISTK